MTPRERERKKFRIPHSPPFPLFFLLSPELCSGNPVLSLPEQPPPITVYLALGISRHSGNPK